MNTKLKSGICTAVIMVMVAVVLLSFGYDPPDPPIPEEGVEVNLGDSDFGSGDSPEPSSEAVPQTVPASPNRIATQNSEPTPSVNASQHVGNTVAPQPTEPVADAPKEPEINRNALFPGRRNQGSGSGSQGQSTGTGDQGKAGGTESSNNYDGNGGGNGNYTLAGRSKVVLPKPEYSSNKQGTVVVAIWVDRQGKVTRAEYQPKGSNTSDGYLVQQAVSAAQRARFNADPSAPEEQKGTITYKFTI